MPSTVHCLRCASAKAFGGSRRENQSLLARQYAGITDILRQLGAEVTQDETAQPLMERQVRRYAAAFGWIDRVCAVQDSQGRLTVELYGEGIDDIMKQGDGFSAGLSALLGVTLTAPEKKRAARASTLRCTSGRRTVRWSALAVSRRRARRSRATTRATFSPTPERRACSCRTAWARVPPRRGTAACSSPRSSGSCVQAFRSETLHAVSPALRLRSDGMRFTTLDAFTLDLFSGRAENLKVRRRTDLHAAERPVDHSTGHGAAHRSGGGGQTWRCHCRCR